MSSFERLKAIILELYEAGGDERLAEDAYVELCLERIEEAHEIIVKMMPPNGSA